MTATYMGSGIGLRGVGRRLMAPPWAQFLFARPTFAVGTDVTFASVTQPVETWQPAPINRNSLAMLPIGSVPGITIGSILCAVPDGPLRLTATTLTGVAAPPAFHV